MCLLSFLEKNFIAGLEYDDAVNLCMALYSDEVHCKALALDNTELTMQKIAEAFANFARHDLIKNYSIYKAVPYGANYHSISDKGHWIEVQASILKLGKSYDDQRVIEIWNGLN